VEGGLIAGETSSWQGVSEETVYEGSGCIATELGEVLGDNQLILQTAVSQNVKIQKSKGCRAACDECGRAQLGLRQTLDKSYFGAFQKLDCPEAGLLTEDRRCLLSLLQAPAYGTSASGSCLIPFHCASTLSFPPSSLFSGILVFPSHLFFFRDHFLFFGPT